MGRERKAAILSWALQASRHWMNDNQINDLKKKAVPERTAFSCQILPRRQILPGRRD
jgi:hypothetical protein